MTVAKFTTDQIKFLEFLRGQGIGLVASHPLGGLFDIEPHEIESFLDDPDQYIADGYSVSKETLHRYRKFMSGFRCIGITKQNTQCRSYSSEGFNVEHPRQFHPGNPDCYCHAHKSQAANKIE